LHQKQGVSCITDRGGNLDETDVAKAMKDYGDIVLRVAKSITGNREDSEDVFSDTFFALWQKVSSFSSSTHLKAWLIRVTINKAKNIVKSAYNRYKTELTENIPFIEKEVTMSEARVKKAMLSLKPADRAVIYLYYYEGYGFEEIAGMLQMRVNGVRSKISRARLKMREMLSMQIDKTNE